MLTRIYLLLINSSSVTSFCPFNHELGEKHQTGQDFKPNDLAIYSYLFLFYSYFCSYPHFWMYELRYDR